MTDASELHVLRPGAEPLHPKLIAAARSLNVFATGYVVRARLRTAWWNDSPKWGSAGCCGLRPMPHEFQLAAELVAGVTRHISPMYWARGLPTRFSKADGAKLHKWDSLFAQEDAVQAQRHWRNLPHYETRRWERLPERPLVVPPIVLVDVALFARAAGVDPVEWLGEAGLGLEQEVIEIALPAADRQQALARKSWEALAAKGLLSPAPRVSSKQELLKRQAALPNTTHTCAISNDTFLELHPDPKVQMEIWNMHSQYRDQGMRQHLVAVRGTPAERAIQKVWDLARYYGLTDTLPCALARAEDFAGILEEESRVVLFDHAPKMALESRPAHALAVEAYKASHVAGAEQDDNMVWLALPPSRALSLVARLRVPGVLEPLVA